MQLLHRHAAACHPATPETVQSAADELVAVLFRAVVPGANPPAATALHLLSSACLSSFLRRSAVTMLCNEIHFLDAQIYIKLNSRDQQMAIQGPRWFTIFIEASVEGLCT